MEPPPGRVSSFSTGKKRAKKVHKADGEMVLQAAVFEIVTKEVEKISIPDWVFQAWELEVKKRNFDYDAMLYRDGKYHNRWRNGASVPNMSKMEIRLWFYYRAISACKIASLRDRRSLEAARYSSCKSSPPRPLISNWAVDPPGSRADSAKNNVEMSNGKMRKKLRFMGSDHR